jgi:hypothetical protein
MEWGAAPDNERLASREASNGRRGGSAVQSERQTAGYLTPRAARWPLWLLKRCSRVLTVRTNQPAPALTSLESLTPATTHVCVRLATRLRLFQEARRGVCAVRPLFCSGKRVRQRPHDAVNTRALRTTGFGENAFGARQRRAGLKLPCEHRLATPARRP